MSRTLIYCVKTRTRGKQLKEDYMDFSVKKEPVFVTEVIYDGQAEQGVEFDYVLPDYYPDIFRILRCTLRPGIVSCNISGDKLILDGVICITALYLSEGGGMECVEHRYSYSKTVDLPKSADNGTVTVEPKADYTTCRAVSGRRIDVRGAVSFRIKVENITPFEIITDIEGCNIQTRKNKVSCTRKLTAGKQFVVREDIGVSGIDGTVKAVVSCDATAVVNDCKIIADKVVLKGEAKLKALYLVGSDNGTYLQTMEAEIPLSQIVDMQGIDERHTCYALFRVLSCALTVKSADDDASGVFGCELTIGSQITATLEESIYPVTDMYSTSYESSYTTSALKTESDHRFISRTLNIKQLIECENGIPDSVTDAECFVSEIICRPCENGELKVSGKLLCFISAVKDGEPVFIEKNLPFDVTEQLGMVTDGCVIQPVVNISSVSYSITDDGIEIRCSLLMQGCMYVCGTSQIIKQIELNENAEKQKRDDYSLKLYFADENEDVWNIAKRYNTSAAAIESENEVTDGKVSGLLLIPII